MRKQKKDHGCCGADKLSTQYHIKSLKMGKSNTICLLVSTIQNPIFAEITQGVEDTARKSGYIVVLCNTDEDEAIEREYIENMKTRWVDGFIICSAVNYQPVY